MQGHAAESEAGAQEGQLGAEVGKPPHFRETRAGTKAPREVATIDMRDLDVFRENCYWNPPAVSSKGMMRRNDHRHPNCQQCFVTELRGRQRPGSYNADSASPFEHRLDHGTRLNVESEQRRRKFLLE